ncbi:SET domain-containing protein 5 [Durusdinium trenchii]
MSPSCAVCEKAGDKMKLCGQCKDRCYCSPECQRLDWKTHKTWCQKNAGKIDQRVNQTLKVVGKGIDPAELFAEHPCCKYVAVIDGKGAGVIASDFIPAGEIIVRDQHILCITGDELGLSDIWSESNKPPAKFDRQHELIKEKFERLSESDQAKVLSLEDMQTNNKLTRAIVDRLFKEGAIKSSWEKLYTLTSVPSAHVSEVQDAGYKSPEGVFKTNSLPVGDSNSVGLFPLISRFNHSCCPNASYRWNHDVQSQVVQAMRDIQAGEEICVTYFHANFMTSDTRQKRTMMGWGFKCQCEACECPGLQEVRELVRSMDDGNMTDDDMTALIGAEKMALIEKSIATNERRQRLAALNTRLNTASSLRMVKQIVEEMEGLYCKEKILPHLLVESQIALDLIQAHVGFGGPEVAKWCQALYDKERLLEGETHPKTRKVKQWLSRTPSVMEVVNYANGNW